MSTALPTCRICGVADHWLGSHLVEAHGMGLDAYLTQYPGAATASEALVAEIRAPARLVRKHPPGLMEHKATFAGFTVRVNGDVPVEACLPLPNAYRVPQHGYLAEDVKAAAVALACGRRTYIWGEAGAGKDAIIHAWSYYTQAPALIFQVEPGADIRSWFFSHEFRTEGTYWQEGELLLALRDGYLSPISGRRIPYIILISDFDRATKEQAESLRLVMDSIEGRVKGPNGVTYKVFPGTMIVATANSAGSGDTKGRYTSSNVIDASILDRFERVFQFHWMDWKDEEIVCKDKFALLVERAPWVFEQVGRSTESLRQAISQQALDGEFSHRAVCAWLGMVEDLITMSPVMPTDILKRAFRAYADKLPDEENRQVALKLIDPFLSGGAVDVGDTSHINKGPRRK